MTTDQPLAATIKTICLLASVLNHRNSPGWQVPSLGT